MFPGVFDGSAGLADAAHAVDGALAFDDNGAFGGEVLAEFGEELIAAFEQGAEGGGEMTNEECRMPNGPDSEPIRHSAFVIRTLQGAVGVPTVLGELGDEGLLPLGQFRWLGSEGGGQLVALNEEDVDGASEVAGDEEFELGVGEEAVLRARVLEVVDGLLGLCRKVSGVDS